ncbi:carboxypeptidase-like regulatory domain-containing protein [Hymenobacter negativus]|uniref:Carboxypeptidase-like regulatory domain-containing protein n=1 Tax=Hymenobacter negativus TaxID=2795026 RepID=A0ABS3Q923_9BACT|nr:carboxypeptidase-like regulatory domain-containing protein [Hymenobacter negativus]MBO2007626.1 carboxypeptidase-like regulatory domain-containing protein [Hymenobacter negativus]
MNIPKPQPCGQNWLAMQPTANGRQCGQCNKEIYDFSAMSWPAIARVQTAHGNALCGMYAPAQLAHWGQSPPKPCARLAAATTLALTLSAITASAQTATPPATSSTLRLSGTVLAASPQGKSEPLAFATVLVTGTTIGTITDEQGHYELTIPQASASNPAAIIRFSRLGFVGSEWELPVQSQPQLQHDALLAADTTIIAFSIRKPSLAARAKWKLKRWFGRKAE